MKRPIAIENDKTDSLTIYKYTKKYDNQSITPAPAEAMVLRKGILQTKSIDDSTLSFSTNPNAGWVTTMEAVNSTGYLIAIQNTTNHVNIIPNLAVESTYGTMADWKASYNNSNAEPYFYTKVLKSALTKVK